MRVVAAKREGPHHPAVPPAAPPSGRARVGSAPLEGTRLLEARPASLGRRVRLASRTRRTGLGSSRTDSGTPTSKDLCSGSAKGTGFLAVKRCVTKSAASREGAPRIIDEPKTDRRPADATIPVGRPRRRFGLHSARLIYRVATGESEPHEDVAIPLWVAQTAPSAESTP